MTNLKKIYLFCSGGMSTSILAKNMQEVSDKHNFPLEIKAFSHNDIEKVIAEKNPDFILFGPQAGYLYEESLQKFAHKNIPMQIIDQNDYGMMDGEKVLKAVIKTMKKNKAEQSKKND